MAKPILIVRVNHAKYTLNQIDELKKVVKEVTGSEYHNLFIGYAPFDGCIDITFEVVGIAEYKESLTVSVDEINSCLKRNCKK